MTMTVLTSTSSTHSEDNFLHKKSLTNVSDFFVCEYTVSSNEKRRFDMDKNVIDHHICSNTHRAVFRDRGGLTERNYVEGGSQGCDSHCGQHMTDPVFVADIYRDAQKNCDFRSILWTGDKLQCTLMSVPKRGEIGAEVHECTDQYIRVEHGSAELFWGSAEGCLYMSRCLRAGEGAFIPAGTWHNVKNIGRCALKLSSVYAPPHHRK